MRHGFGFGSAAITHGPNRFLNSFSMLNIVGSSKQRTGKSPAPPCGTGDLTARRRIADIEFFHQAPNDTLADMRVTRGDRVEMRWRLGGDSSLFFHHFPAHAEPIRIDA